MFLSAGSNTTDDGDSRLSKTYWTDQAHGRREGRSFAMAEYNIENDEEATDGRGQICSRQLNFLPLRIATLPPTNPMDQRRPILYLCRPTTLRIFRW